MRQTDELSYLAATAGFILVFRRKLNTKVDKILDMCEIVFDNNKLEIYPGSLKVLGSLYRNTQALARVAEYLNIRCVIKSERAGDYELNQ
jgi:hypothetical protein